MALPSLYKEILSALQDHADPEKAVFLPKFFQSFPGGYGEGDKFLGVRVPEQRKIARLFRDRVSVPDLEKLLRNPFHEVRLTGAFLLIHRFEKAKTDGAREELVELYLRNLAGINNWDLVDSSAPKILGPWLEKKDRSLLYELARSGELWKERISILTTLHFIKKNDFTDALSLCEFFLNHRHDLMHKATGWMLREIGNRDPAPEIRFLKKYYSAMPRTMLRYSIEKFDESERKRMLKGDFKGI